MRDLFDFAYFPKFDHNIEKLAELAQDEDWEYKNTSSSQNQNQKKPILRSYLKYTFRRLQEENKVVELENAAVFNTGLATKHQEEIIAYFVLNPNKGQQKWCFESFLKESDRLLLSVNPMPELASYFDNPSKLFYDLSCGEPRISTEHIYRNKERLPERYKSMTEQAFYNNILGGIKTAIKRVKRNYKTAVPQYFWDRNATEGELQLLLPICLTDESVDAALAVKRVDNVYSARTILTFDDAYNNARLIAKPDTEWLQP